jgi:F-type H+-transporting ATPase subunit b
MSINFFWVIVAACNFILFLALIWVFGFRPIASMLDERSKRLEQGLADAEAARKERESAQVDREAVIQQARQEAGAMLAAAQKSAQDLRDADIAATKADLEQMRQRAAADIIAERDRAMADLRASVADLALEAAGRLVSETMTDARQRRLVEDFIKDGGSSASGSDSASKGRRN